MNPKYPIYVISKGRWTSRLTSRALEKMNVPYRIVIEPQEFEQYSKVIDPKKILTLPFSNLGQGSIPARNWVWEHSISEGHKRHWILDDNVERFGRLYNNQRLQVLDGTTFRCAEDFTDRYENIALSGMQYQGFVEERTVKQPFILNTRIYSIILIKNDIPYRWRGKYNEDTDLSIRALKDGYCTVLFYAFYGNKKPTMVLKGGNTDELYKQDEQFDGRLEMARSLQQQHPDIVTITRRWGRWQHLVDYSKFKYNKLIKKKGVIINNKIDNYGMELVKLNDL